MLRLSRTLPRTALSRSSAARPPSSMSRSAWNSAPLRRSPLAKGAPRRTTPPPGDPEPGTKAFTHRFRWLGVPVGGIAGLFGSLVGVGGGVIMVPMMTCRPLQLQARFASATSLVAVLGTGSVAAVCYTYDGLVDPVGAGIIATFAMLTAPAGARATMRISNVALKRIMGLFIVVVAPSVPFKDHLFPQPAHPPPPAPHSDHGSPSVTAPASSPLEAADEGGGGAWDYRQYPGFLQLSENERVQYAVTLAGAGSVAGFLSGLMGIGGGIIVTPILAISSGMSQHAVVGTSMVAMIFPSAVSLYTHHRLGNVRWPVGRMLLLGSALGAAVGVQVARSVDDPTMKKIFATGMFLLGIKTLHGAR